MTVIFFQMSSDDVMRYVSTVPAIHNVSEYEREDAIVNCSKAIANVVRSYGIKCHFKQVQNTAEEILLCAKGVDDLSPHLIEEWVERWNERVLQPLNLAHQDNEDYKSRNKLELIDDMKYKFLQTQPTTGGFHRVSVFNGLVVPYRIYSTMASVNFLQAELTPTKKRKVTGSIKPSMAVGCPKINGFFKLSECKEKTKK